MAAQDGEEVGVVRHALIDGVHKLSREMKNLLLPDELGMQQVRLQWSGNE